MWHGGWEARETWSPSVSSASLNPGSLLSLTLTLGFCLSCGWKQVKRLTEVAHRKNCICKGHLASGLLTAAAGLYAHDGGMADGDGEPAGVNVLCHLKATSVGTNSGSHPVGVCVCSEADGTWVCERQRMGMCRRRCKGAWWGREVANDYKLVKDLQKLHGVPIGSLQRGIRWKNAFQDSWDGAPQ